MLVVFANASENEEVFISKRVYEGVSKNAIFEAAKTLFILSNEKNGNKDFLIDAYRDKLEVHKVIFEDNIIKIDITLDKWLFEVHQTQTETRANLIFIRRDGTDLDDIESFDKNLHQLFWDRLEYLLGLNTEWKRCSSYFELSPFSGFCNNYLITSAPSNEYIQKDILIAKENIKINTIDNVKADILIETDLTLSKSKNDIFNQSENIEDSYFSNPLTIDNILETEAEKKQRVRKEQNTNEEQNVGIEDLKEGELLDVNKQMSKFKEDLENIINMKPQNSDTDSNKIIMDSDKLKENSEFDLKSKEKK
jgi:hypothetical protein